MEYEVKTEKVCPICGFIIETKAVTDSWEYRSDVEQQVVYLNMEEFKVHQESKECKRVLKLKRILK